MFHPFTELTEFERDRIRERTQAGLTSATALGRKGEAPDGLDTVVGRPAQVTGDLLKARPHKDQAADRGWVARVGDAVERTE